MRMVAGSFGVAFGLIAVLSPFPASADELADFAKKDREELNRFRDGKAKQPDMKPAPAVAQAPADASAKSAEPGSATKAPFPVNPQRQDPYKNFKFRVKWDGKYVYGITRVSPLLRTTEVLDNQAGGDPSSPRKSPGRTVYSAIVLERGVTQDKEFENWANLVWQFGAGLGAESSPKTFRKDVMIELYNEAGQLVKAYKVFRCWPSKYEALPVLDSNGSEIAMESLTLQTEGWERDTEVAEPAEKSKP